MHKKSRLLAAAALATLALTSCGSDEDPGEDADAGGDTLRLVASFYPLQYAAQRVAGDTADVASLTKPGAEPHDLELNPQDVAKVGDADLVIYLSGFQPAVDEAVAEGAEDSSFDAADAATLDLTFTPIEEGEEHADEAGSVDPHFWLDPTRLADVAANLAERLGELDPDRAQSFLDNAADLRADLEDLDAELEEGLADCADKDIVTSHNAFGYLAQRYGLNQVGITGLTPEDEPSPEDLVAVTAFVEENDVRTIYYETLVSPAIAETVAAETGAETAVLDPIEGLNDESEGSDYLEVMRANLSNLQAGQPCT